MNKLPIALVASALLLASCGEEAKPEPKVVPKPESTPQPVQETPKPAEPSPVSPAVPAPVPTPEPAKPTYTVRAEIDTLPGIASSVLRLHHERIPTFASRDGKIGNDSQGKPGMKPMTMSFAKGPGVSYEGLKQGDKVEVVVEVNWEAAIPDDRLVITKLTKLPAESKLNFEGQPSISDPKPAAPKPEPK
ncbi:MAG: hypothetical protein ACREJD_07355 [Phycisphaerales bacterium]